MLVCKQEKTSHLHPGWAGQRSRVYAHVWLHATSIKQPALERVAQRGSGGPIPGNIPDQVGQGSEQPDLVSGVPARCGGVGLDDL